MVKSYDFLKRISPKKTLFILSCFLFHLLSLLYQLLFANLKISPKTPLAVTLAPAPAPWITIGCSP